MKIASITPVFMPALCTALGAATLAAVLFVQASQEAQRVRLHTETLARQALSLAGHRWARFEIAEDEGRLLGEAPDARSRAAALRAVRQVLAPAMAWPAVFRTLKDGTRVAAPQAASAETAAVDALTSCTARVDAALGGRPILFELGSARLTAESRRRLAGVAGQARECPARLAVVGHTDASGEPALNQRLSEQRARAVVAALVEAGMPAERLYPQGLGASQPLVAGQDAAARALNRRIEFQWTAEVSSEHAA